MSEKRLEKGSQSGLIKDVKKQTKKQAVHAYFHYLAYKVR